MRKAVRPHRYNPVDYVMAKVAPGAYARAKVTVSATTSVE